MSKQTELESKIQQIIQEKTTKIIPENIKSGVQIFDVVGTADIGDNIIDTEGQDVSVSSTTLVFGDNLPYTELEYIESTGTQYIDTNIKPKHTMIFETDVELTTLAENIVFWGSRNEGYHSSNNNQCYLNYFTQTSDYIYCYTTATTDLNNNWHNNLEIVVSTPFHLKNIACVNTMVDSNYNITLFGLNNIGVMTALSKCKISLFRVKDNGVLVANFIPVKRKSDNEICMYDKVTKQFFTNQGTGSFIAGPEIN